MSNVTTATAKAGLGGGGAVVAATSPSEYISYFDRVYDIGWFEISGDDMARTIGMVVGVLVSINILYNIGKDWRTRRAKKSVK